jgi:uncharacterized protein YhfF
MVRDEPAPVEGFRRAYAQATGDGADLPAFAFGDGPELADELAGLVRHGRKRATASLLADLESDGDPVPAVGDRSIILDGRGAAVCVIETTDVRVGPLGAVDPAFAWDEGEGDRSREDWLDGHRRFFARRCEVLGLDLGDELAVVFERFAVSWPEPDRPAPLAAAGETLVRELRFDEQPWAEAVLRERWGDAECSTPRGAHRAGSLPGLVADRGGVPVGLATFRPWPGGVAEVVSLDALEPGSEHTSLLRAALDTIARREGWQRVEEP